MAMTPDEAGYVQALEAKVRELEAEIAKLEIKIKNLFQEKGLSSARDGLTQNDRTGTWVDASTGRHHCTRCLLKDDKRIPLNTEPHGWRCMVCNRFYEDPDNPEGPGRVLDMGGGGPQGWMR